ncbi:hypothetical protein EG328_005808 [Venturia inaequalis]|uniref:Uncharacterized protein n=1 Tax=Venturia inaequalis TaxID=5025 RepID=A0A8H3YRZ2_VENIN|nr:hypothetical protein EG328_005808 [Venturia inaequalis]
MGFPTGPAQSYRNPNSIPGLGSLVAPNPNNPSKYVKAYSLEPGEIGDGMEMMEEPRIDELRIVAMEVKMEKLEKDNDALRKLVAHLCVGVASISDNIPKIAQQESNGDLALDKMAADMRATLLENKETVVVRNPDTPMSDQLTEDTTSGAEQGPPSTTVQYLSKSQEKVTKEFLAIQKRMANVEAGFESHRKNNAKDRADVHVTRDTQKKTTEAIQIEIKDLKRMLERVTEGNDQARRTDLHQRIKMAMQMRLHKDQYTQLWEKLIQVAASSGSTILEQVYSAQRSVQKQNTGINFIASKLYNAALAGPLPAQIGHVRSTRRDLEMMRSGRVINGPNDIRIMLQSEDIVMFNHIIEQIEEMFKELKKTNPRWEVEIRAHEPRAIGFNNASNNNSNNGNSPRLIPAGPKRAREDDEEREKERLDRELDRDFDDRRESWGQRQQQLGRNRNGQPFQRQRGFAEQGYGSRDNPSHDSKRRR